MFLPTSSRTGRSRPFSAKSSSICRSHAASSRSRMNEASSANSRGDSVSTASLISVRLTLEECQSKRAISSSRSRGRNRQHARRARSPDQRPPRRTPYSDPFHRCHLPAAPESRDSGTKAGGRLFLFHLLLNSCPPAQFTQSLLAVASGGRSLSEFVVKTKFRFGEPPFCR